MSTPQTQTQAPLLVVYGATGGTGKPLVTKALQDGLRVRAFVRDSSRLPPSISSNPNLQVYKGDLTDLPTVTAALEGATYAICVAGSRELSADKGMTKVVEAIIDGMQRHGVTRFLYQAGAFSPMPGQKLPFMVRTMRAVFGTLMGAKNILADNDAAIEALSATKDIQWVVVRPGFINGGPSKGKLVEKEKGGKSVMYVDLAAFNLEAVQTEQYNGKGLYPTY